MIKKLFLILFLLLPLEVYASVGEIADISGSGAVRRDSDDIEAGIGLGLEMQDAITTGNGRMQLEFEDSTRVDVTEHSRMVIDEFIYDPSTGTGSLGMRATLGAVRYASGQIARNSRANVNIQTPSATIGVRGTDFMMIVDEIGGSMITLLPSCNTNGQCVVGEITVESDEGVVIMNQAFQTTVVQHRGAAPMPPKVLDLPENMLRSMLIVRRVSPYDEIPDESDLVRNILDIDFLEFNGLDEDLLAQHPNRWATDLDNNTFLNEVYVDALDNLMKQLISIFQSELDAQNAEMLRIRLTGLDLVTGIFYDENPPNFIFRRTENAHVTQLVLNQSNGYNINLIQNSYSIYGYRVGVGSNDIYINQQD